MPEPISKYSKTLRSPHEICINYSINHVEFMRLYRAYFFSLTTFNSSNWNADIDDIGYLHSDEIELAKTNLERAMLNRIITRACMEKNSKKLAECMEHDGMNDPLPIKDSRIEHNVETNEIDLIVTRLIEGSPYELTYGMMDLIYTIAFDMYQGLSAEDASRELITKGVPINEIEGVMKTIEDTIKTQNDYFSQINAMIEKHGSEIDKYNNTWRNMSHEAMIEILKQHIKEQQSPPSKPIGFLNSVFKFIFG